MSPEPLFSRFAPEDLPEDLQAAREASISSSGDGTRLEVFGHHPFLYRWYHSHFYELLFNGRDGDTLVDIKWKELIRLRLSLGNGCFVCNAHNVPAALRSGYTQEQIDAICTADSPLFSPQEQAVVALGAMFEIQDVDPQMPPELYARLQAYFSEGEILELGFVASILSAYTKFTFAFDLVARTCSIDGGQKKAS